MNGRVFVQVWCEVDPTLNLRIDRQTAAPVAEDGDRLVRVSPLGRLAVAEAVGLGSTEVTAFALGDEHEAALRHALAAGAARAVRLRATEPSDGDTVIGGLAAWLASQGPDLVIADRLAGQVAGRLGWAHLAGLEQLRVEGGFLTALRSLGRSGHEKVTARMPAIVRLQAEPPNPPYVAQARIARAGLKAIEETVIRAAPNSQRPVEIGPLQILRPRTRLAAAAAAPMKAADRLNALMGLGNRAQGKPPAKPAAGPRTLEQMAGEFVRFLAHQNLLDDL